jgi:cell division initiation protein
VALTPVEIRHLSLPRGMFGYKRDTIDRTLAEIVSSFEDVWRERADLADKVESLEADALRFRELESLLRTTLVSAERSAAELKAQAHREVDVILAEAHAEARAVTRRALADNERLLADARRIREQLRGALVVIDEPVAARPNGDGRGLDRLMEEDVADPARVAPVH